MEKMTRKTMLGKLRRLNYSIFLEIHKSKKYVLKQSVLEILAALKIQRWWKKNSKGLKFGPHMVNSSDVFTREKMRGPLFYLVDENNKIFGFEPQSLAQFFHEAELKNPFNNRRINEIEVKRLCRMLPGEDREALETSRKEAQEEAESRLTVDFLIEEFEQILSASPPGEMQNYQVGELRLLTDQMYSINYRYAAIRIIEVLRNLYPTQFEMVLEESNQ